MNTGNVTYVRSTWKWTALPEGKADVNP